MFSLSILFLTITSTNISFLTPLFVHSQIICMNDIKYDYAIENATGHFYNLNVTDKECYLTVRGNNPILYPSVRDSLTIKLDSSFIK